MAEIVPEITWLEAGKHRGKCVVEPLVRGYGTTLGNALRRILLSQITGAAIAAMKIEGIQHEFATAPGMRESALEFMLNVKKVAFRAKGTGEWTCSVYARGEGEVLAGDIKTPPDLEIVNPELHLMTLTAEEAVLDAEFIVRTGKGYCPSEDHTDLPRNQLGLIPVDSIFSPVTGANAIVEPTRVGRDTNYDRLVLDVTTNGSITPEEAVDAAAKDLLKHLRIFLTVSGAPLSAEEGGLGLGDGDVTRRRIEDMGFSQRAFNCLQREGIETLGQLMQKSVPDLMAMKNFGRKSLDEIIEKLDELGLSLKSEEGPAVEEAPDYIEE